MSCDPGCVLCQVMAMAGGPAPAKAPPVVEGWAGGDPWDLGVAMTWLVVVVVSGWKLMSWLVGI